MFCLPGLDLPGVAQYLVQRRPRSCPFDDGHRLHYLAGLRRVARREFCAVHAYVLMADHVRLLVTPMAPGQALRMMEALARHQRGGICEGRCRAWPVFDDGHILRCQRYIESAPVRAGIVAHPGLYRWSSYAGNASPAPDPLLQPHRAWLALGGDAVARRRAWQGLVMAVSGPQAKAGIRARPRSPGPSGQVAAR